MKTEKRQIKAHPHLAFDAITRQAGTLAKAVLEGIMNSVDARSSYCKVDITPTKITITDDGTGIDSREHIENFFESLGSPHDPSEKKIFGTFRIGRGQLFSFGRNVWRTSEFLMDVDFKNKGFDYELQSELEQCVGCTIEMYLYKELYPSDISELIRSLNKMAKYASINVTVNEKLISIDPMTEKWDIITDEAYIRMNSSVQLAIYNLGVWVKDYGNYDFGCGGVVVSKKQLMLNFPRNDIMVNECSVWKKVKKYVDKKATEKNKNKPILDEGERQRLAHQIISGDVGGKYAAEAKVFTDVTGKHISAQQIYQMCHAKNITHAKKGDVRGDKLTQSKVMLVLATETLERFETDMQGLVRLIQRECGQSYYYPTIVEFSTATQGMNEYHVILDKKLWTKREEMFLDIFNRNSYLIKKECSSRQSIRSVIVGSSTVFNAWTDGRTYIAFSREFIKSLSLDIVGMTDFFGVGLHEYCHSDNDSASHIHGLEFYQKFHDSYRCVGLAVHNAMSNMDKILARYEIQVTRQALKAQDVKAKVKQVAIRHPELVGKLTNEEPEVAAQVAAQVERVVKVAKREIANGDSKSPYNSKTSYGVLFLLGSIEFIQKDALLKVCSEATGKSVSVLAMSLQVLSNPNHKCNKNRSMVEKNAEGLIKIVSLV
jgi:hypothetical protein